MTLLLAFLLEWLIGDPQSSWHPVALFGRWTLWCESLLYGDSCMSGVIAWLIVTIMPLGLLWGGHLYVGWLFDVLLLWAALGWKSLFQHVQAVIVSESRAEARLSVAQIVSRDTAAMSEQDARRAALESLAENASDAVVAPLFWFLLLGPVGAVLYRMLNTLDAMWGYRNSRYQAFGWWAARVDDVANWIPARITAWLMLRVGRSTDWRVIQKQASTHASPNAGWPEVALAYAADVQLGGSVIRAGIIDERPFYGSDAARDANMIAACEALLIVRHALLLAALLACGINLVL
ncbi:MAG: adenosylcobinamide-phosphate synthase CbiB [Mariprofundus sp.]|nr:adenosylcobinamide-phosphate synthase CbiB [Mariprofundus sp.]